MLPPLGLRLNDTGRNGLGPEKEMHGGVASRELVTERCLLSESSSLSFTT